MTTWDDLLDDYERRIEAISLALATDSQVPTHAFIPPRSSIADPTPQQLQRFQALQAKAGENGSVGLDAQKRKVGFLERLANVGRGKKDEDAEMPSKMEPDFAPTPVAGRPAPRPQAPQTLSVQPPANRVAAPAPKRIEAQPQPQPRVLHGQVAAAIAHVESLGDDDLEIPAFLRRRAN